MTREDLDLGELLKAKRTGDYRPVLSPRQLEVVRLRMKDYSFAYIGLALGISEASARTHYRRAVENARNEVLRRSKAGD